MIRKYIASLVLVVWCCLGSHAFAQSYNGPPTIQQPTVAGNCVEIGPNGGSQLVDAGAACGSGTAPSAANPTATVGNSAVNGVATTYMRSDAAPALGFPILAPNGSQSAPSYSFEAAPTTGMYREDASNLPFAIGGSRRFNIITTGVRLPNGNTLGWSSTTDPLGAADTILVRDGAANTLAQRNAANAQTFRIYNTYTDALNYERASYGWATNAFRIGTEAAGSGSQRDLVFDGLIVYFRTGSTNRWFFDGSGNFRAFVDNTYDIGTTSNRPRTIMAGTSIQTGGTTVGALPTCNAGLQGNRRFVTDATAPTWLGALTGGGAVVTPVFCNGSAWVSG